jgi:hypothetical protein
MTAGGAAAWARTQLADWPIEVAVADDVEPADPVGDWTDSGVVALTGRADGPPLVPPGAAATAARGAEQAFAALLGDATCVPHADGGTRPPVGWHRLLGERAALAELRRRAPWSPGGACRAVACADGWAALSLARADDVATVPALTETAAPLPDVAAAWSRIDAWAASGPVAEVVARATLLGLACGAIPAAGGWHGRGPLPPGEATAQVRRVACEPGEAPPPTIGPLVVDLSALWAGPLCAHLLGLAGARVVKVEMTGRLDGARRGEPRFYDLLHRGHDSVVVEPTGSDGRRLLRSLLDRADIVVESSRPRAMRTLGIDPLEVLRRTPTTWVAITAYGRTCPDRVGFGDDVAMSAGLVAYEAGSSRPLPCGDALADPLTGMHAAVAALASYRIGGSRLLDVAMRDVVAATLAWQPEPQPTLTTESGGGGWTVRDGDRMWSVAAPTARRVVGSAAPPAGRDSAGWRVR